MKRNPYSLKAEILRRKYQDIVADFEDTLDDRRVAFNTYTLILEVCDEMEKLDTENACICCAVNNRISMDEQMIDKIVNRFTGKSFIKNRWMTAEEADAAEGRISVSYRLFSKRLEELSAEYREHGIFIENAARTEGKFVDLAVNWASCGAVSTRDAREFIWWMQRACEAADRFEYNGYRIIYGEPDCCIWYAQDGETEVIDFVNGENPDAVFGQAAEMVAFSDLSDIEVGKIVVNGRECRYSGWQPGMHIAFEDCETGEVVWEAYFPEWDH